MTIYHALAILLAILILVVSLAAIQLGAIADEVSEAVTRRLREAGVLPPDGSER